MRAFLWGVLLLLILTGGHLWPKQDSFWLVVVADGDDPRRALQLVEDTSSRIVDLVDNNKIIISPSATMQAGDLYNVGALLVVNAAAGFGCSPPTKDKWAKT